MAGGNWWWFLVLFLTPDLSIAGYLANPRIGSLAYNVIHTYAMAAILLGMGWFFYPSTLLAGLLLTAHIGLDRCLGFGLKYPTAFKDTHIQRV
jgi:hypothetical protein